MKQNKGIHYKIYSLLLPISAHRNMAISSKHLLCLLFLIPLSTLSLVSILIIFTCYQANKVRNKPRVFKIDTHNQELVSKVRSDKLTDMQKVAATRPLVAEIFSDCGRKKTGIPLILWKLSAQIL